MLLAAVAPVAAAAPFTPASDDEVVATVPVRRDPELAALDAERRLLDAEPGNAALRESLAQRYVELGKSRNEPRYLGYAEALLAPALADPGAPPSLYFLRARIAEEQHDFGAALQDLTKVQEDPHLGGSAALMRANLLQLQGRFPEARAECARVARHSRASAAVCTLAVDSVSGRLEESWAQLRAIWQAGVLPAQLRGWAAGILADMADRRGYPDQALAILAALPRESADSVYLRTLRADLQLASGQRAQVLTSLGPEETRDGLLLRALMARGARESDGDAQALALGERMDRLVRRGANPHLREVAMFALHVRADASGAFDAALANWQVQRETVDVRLVLEAAELSGRMAEAAPVREWIAQTGYQDAWITRNAGLDPD